MEQVVTDNAGMRCPDRVQPVNAVHHAPPEVEQVEGALAAGQASISYDPELANVTQFKEAIEAAGFDAR